VLAVIHDSTLDRTTNQRGAVADLYAEQLADIDAGDGATIPTLTQVVDLLRSSGHTHTGLNIELKGPATAAPVASLLAPCDALPVLVSSFDHQQLVEFRSLDKHTPVAPLFDRWQKNWRQIAEQLQACAVNLSLRAATRARVAAINAAGYDCFVYTVNRPAQAQRLADFGVKGVFSDRPDLLLNSIST